MTGGGGTLPNPGAKALGVVAGRWRRSVGKAKYSGTRLGTG